MAQIKGAIDAATGIYRIGRSISGAVNTASAIGNIANMLGIGQEEDSKKFDPRDNDPFTDGDI